MSIPSFPTTSATRQWRTSDSAAMSRGSKRVAKGRSTTAWAWVILVALDVAVSTALVPGLMADLHARVPPDIAEGVGNAELLDTSLRIGAYLSVPAHALAMTIFALVSRSLELHLFDASKRLVGSLRVGAFWVLLALTSLPVQAVLLVNSDVRGSAGHFGYVVIALLATLILFWHHWTRLTASRRVLVAAVAIAFVLAMTLGT